MCGLVGAISKQDDMVPCLVEGLRRLEYRGYDSAGLAAISERGLQTMRTVGPVNVLADRLAGQNLSGSVGIGHTRWATHGGPSEVNAHPHLSGNEIAVVHNGIVENHEALRAELIEAGYQFESETDTEVLAHLIHFYTQKNCTLQEAVLRTTHRLEGGFALAVISSAQPNRIVAARRDSPLLIGVGADEKYVASDVVALLPITRYFISLEEGDVAEILPDSVNIIDKQGQVTVRELKKSQQKYSGMDKSGYAHYMLKEIFEQHVAIEHTLNSSLDGDSVSESAVFGDSASLLQDVEHIHIVACGTSYHAGLVASYTIESLCGISCRVERASEYRYRRVVVNPRTLFITLSQSGETADTLAALRYAKSLGYLTTGTICNVPDSSLVRESDIAFMTHAGPEIGVASTKAFTTQLINLYVLAILLARYQGLGRKREASLVKLLKKAPAKVEAVYSLNERIQALAERYLDKEHALFVGRGQMYPIAMEGALKLKEISYINADAHAAGELKHGPLALVDESMPVIALAPCNLLLSKLKSNLSEIRSRGGSIVIFSDEDSGFAESEKETVIEIPRTEGLVAPIIYNIPLQMLAYHVAVLRGNNVDKPRNLAKSVTVE